MKAFLGFIVAIGVALAVLTGASGAGPPLWGLILFKCLPYAMLLVIGASLRAARITFADLGVILAGMALVTLDVAVYISVFYFPGSSTDAIALFTLPFFQAFGVIPAMFLLAFIVQWMRRGVRTS
jgi:hypothetical protein